MGHVRYTSHLDGAPETAWGLATTTARIPEWHPLCSRVDQASGHLEQPGESAGIVVLVAGRQFDGRVEVAAAERPKRLTLVGSAGEDIRFTWTWRFVRLGAGVEISVDLDFELGQDLAREPADVVFLERAVGRSTRSAVENFTDLAHARQGATVFA